MFDAEIAMNVYEMHKVFDFKEIDINLDVIKAVGPRGHFLRQKHTRAHMRDFHYSPIFHQMDADGKLRDPQEMALEEFNKIYENHKPEPLQANILKELDQILFLADNMKPSLEG
jgi:trimethylamine--corrinoid protein Co-methyltransferase